MSVFLCINHCLLSCIHMYFSSVYSDLLPYSERKEKPGQINLRSKQFYLYDSVAKEVNSNSNIEAAKFKARGNAFFPLHKTTELLHQYTPVDSKHMLLIRDVTDTNRKVEPTLLSGL